MQKGGSDARTPGKATGVIRLHEIAGLWTLFALPEFVKPWVGR